ncbi:MAG: 2-amino-4-hydroxy-6-hydroxymethyldihydropteridine diphosphokinase [Pseudomonadota bacterium]
MKSRLPITAECPDAEGGSPDRGPAVIALGANLPGDHGAPAQAVRAAMCRLEALARGAVQCSSLWRSRPVDCPPESPDFINAVALLQPLEETPVGLLSRLQQLEDSFGRARDGGRNTPRVLDLDLIAWGDHVCDTARLTLPHPRAHRRAFVLLPLAEVFPNLVLPGQSRNVRELAEQCPGRNAVFRV